MGGQPGAEQDRVAALTAEVRVLQNAVQTMGPKAIAGFHMHCEACQTLQQMLSWRSSPRAREPNRASEVTLTGYQ